MVPHHHAAERRQPLVPPGSPGDESEIDAGHREEQAGEGGPDHNLGPQAGILSQHPRIEPVRDGPQPGQHPISAGGDLSHLARARRDMDHRAGRIAHLDAPERPALVEVARDRPLVPLHEAGGGGRRAGMLSGHLHRLLPAERRQDSAGQEIERLTAGAQDGSIRHGLDHTVLQGLGGAEAGQVAALRPGDRRQAGAPLGLGDFRPTHEEHDDAAGEPDQHEQPHGHAEVAMGDHEPTRRPRLAGTTGGLWREGGVRSYRRSSHAGSSARRGSGRGTVARAGRHRREPSSPAWRSPHRRHSPAGR